MTTRSDIMRAVRSTDTQPELIVRRIAHRLGFRFRLHRKDLPGSPDLVFPRLQKIIFVHGCFWHGHDCKRGARTPKQNRPYWTAKIARNAARDREVIGQLETNGWRTLVIWECEIRDAERLAAQIRRFLSGSAKSPRRDSVG